MKIKGYTAHFNDNIYLVGPLLPTGIIMDDPCRPCIILDKTGQFDPIKNIISVSDDFWLNAFSIPNYDLGWAIEWLGGRKTVEEEMKKIIEEWREKK